MSKSVFNKRLGIPGLIMLIAAGGCGVSFDEETTRLDMVPESSGSLIRDGIFFPVGQTRDSIIMVGDSSRDDTFCGFVSIDLNSLPGTAIVSRVVLNLNATIPLMPEGTAGDAFADFREVTVDHVDAGLGINAAHYVGETITASIATVPAFTGRQAIALDVTNAVNADRVARKSTSTFRFRFDAAPSLDGQNDAIAIEASLTDPTQRPFATVTILRPDAAPDAP